MKPFGLARTLQLGFALLYCTWANWIFAESVMPSAPAVSYSNSVSFDFGGHLFRFFYTGADGTLEYEYAPVANGSLNPLRCKVNGAYVVRPSNVGGLSLVTNTTEIFPWQGGVSFQLLDAHANSNVLQTTWRCRPAQTI